jgi:hypothetical protein
MGFRVARPVHRIPTMPNSLVRLGTSFRVGGVGAAVLALAASTSVEGGERGNSGWCPEGEQCADDTPQGLSFEGQTVSWSMWGEGGVSATAVGGTQTVRLWDKETGLELDVPFVVDTTNRVAHSAAVGDGPEAVVSAPFEGQGYLRIARVADNYLFDRLLIESAPIARIEARPSLRASYPTGSFDQWAVLAGGTTEVAVGLFTANELRLIDESMQLATPTASARTAWDAVRITVPAGERGYEVAVASGTFTGVAGVPVVDDITEITTWGATGGVVGESKHVCFLAKSGTLDVHGIGWTFEVAGAAEPAPAAEQIYERCVKIVPTRAGTATVIARAGVMSSTVELQVGAARRAAGVDAAEVVSDELEVPGDFGERAAAQLD